MMAARPRCARCQTELIARAAVPMRVGTLCARCAEFTTRLLEQIKQDISEALASPRRRLRLVRPTGRP